jgi:hypothetical protein
VGDGKRLEIYRIEKARLKYDANFDAVLKIMSLKTSTSRFRSV